MPLFQTFPFLLYIYTAKQLFHKVRGDKIHPLILEATEPKLALMMCS
jgi:hypothetical protein